jgi:hypothetical protein
LGGVCLGGGGGGGGGPGAGILCFGNVAMALVSFLGRCPGLLDSFLRRFLGRCPGLLDSFLLRYLGPFPGLAGSCLIRFSGPFPFTSAAITRNRLKKIKRNACDPPWLKSPGAVRKKPADRKFPHRGRGKQGGEVIQSRAGLIKRFISRPTHHRWVRGELLSGRLLLHGSSDTDQLALIGTEGAACREGHGRDLCLVWSLVVHKGEE